MPLQTLINRLRQNGVDPIEYFFGVSTFEINVGTLSSDTFYDLPPLEKVPVIDPDIIEEIRQSIKDGIPLAVLENIYTPLEMKEATK